jgi:long-chain acyl-CoA synthetase
VPTPPDLEWPTFGIFLAEIEKSYAGRTALRYRTRGAESRSPGRGGIQTFEEWSYARLAAEASALAAFLLGHGLGPGDRVALWSENRLEWAAAYLGIVAHGLVVVPIDALADTAEAAAIIATAEAAALLVSAKLSEGLDVLASGTPSLKLTVVIGGSAESSDARSITLRSWDEAVAEGRPAGRPPIPVSMNQDSLASIIFTSGTTGKPKGVMLSHGGIIANIDAARQALPIDERDVFMCVLPLHHTYPTTCSLLSPLSIGASVTICEKVVGKVIVDDVRDSYGSVMIAVPLLYDKLAQALVQGVAAKPAALRGLVGALLALSRLGLSFGRPGFGVALLSLVRAQTGLGSLRLLVAGGGPLSASTAAVYDEFGFSIVQGYGMSENGPLISTNSPERRDHRSAGFPVRRTELRIADAGTDGVGEIQVRSPSLMLGYWRDDEATAAAFTADGWLRTGDLGRIDQRGFVFITGRIKSIIVTSGGKNIYPEEIEAKFEGSHIVKEILVLGKRASEGASAPGRAASASASAAGAARSGGARSSGGAVLAPADLAETVVAVVVPDLDAIAARLGAQAAADAATVRALVKEEIEHVNRSLQPYKKIIDFQIRETEFEKTSSRKIKRFLYRSWAEATTR